METCHMAEHCRESRLKACVGFQPMLYWLFLTLSGISPANRSRSGPKSCTCTGQGPTTFTKCWTRSAKWGRNGGLERVPDAGFFCKQYQTTFRQLRNGRFSPNLATTRESQLKRRFWTTIYEKFPFRGHLPQKTQTWRG